ncbi:MAG TPA: hypothetical protein ENI02_02970 [Candidatus Aminicenantes bacterium]|nr:hypothetical protein [Candidatus Aminicenantes bacterium]
MQTKKTKSQIGKASRAAGARFELKVRKDLESKGWIVSKWMNNVEFGEWHGVPETKFKRKREIKLIPAKHKFRGPGIPMAIGTGFPDFIIYANDDSMRRDLIFDRDTIAPENIKFESVKMSFIIGVEVKSNGYLDKIEKEKCRWLLQNKVFSKILVASKSSKRGEIIYKEFVEDKK